MRLNHYIRCVLGASLFLSCQLHAATWTVCAVGCDFSTIQAGINGAVAGDRLDIAAESFSEKVTIDRDIVLDGAGETQTSVYHGADSVITVDPGVTATIRDMEIYGGMGLEGGGVHNSGTLTIKFTTIRDNFALHQGGGIWTDGDLTLKHVTVRDNGADVVASPNGVGGGIYIKRIAGGNVVVNNSEISNNAACGGGGIFNDSADLVILRSSITDNIAGPGFTCGGHLFAHGGGILNLGLSGGITKIRKSTISGNSAFQAGGGVAALYSATITFTNSTLSGNDANTSGGAVYVYDFPSYSSTLALNNTTVTANTAASSGGLHILGGLFGGNPTITSRNSIVADQAAGGDCGLSNAGSFITDGHNIESGTSCGFNDVLNGDQQNVAPGFLLPLANNGGSTETHALPVGSVAIDAGDPLGCKADMDADGVLDATLLQDQRDQSRGITVCDAGAYEL